eukprot:XP_011607251.1 PREDICTED: cAMP-regulated phosphoprotein 21-like [Takifugu rubripes]
MNEAAAESADAPSTPCDATACDLIICPSPSPPPSFCKQKDECSNNNKKLEQQQPCNQAQPKKKVKAKGKLVRSMAVCEESSPFEEPQAAPGPDVSSSCNVNERTSCKEEEGDGSADPKKHPLSKESSLEYTDSTGIDLHQFMVDTLNSNPRDRMTLLKLEQDMIDFITSNSPFKKFPQMSSYHRMLVHRVAAYFGMEHNVDQTGKSVIINRTSSTRIPEQRFLDEVHKDNTEEITHWKSILKRDNSSDDQSRLHPLREKQSKSVEEREEEYKRARDRIFSQEPQDGAHAETRAEEYNPYAETQRRRQLFRGSRDSSGSSWTGSSRQSSTEVDCRYSNDPQPWSSTDSDSSYQWASPAPKPRQPATHSWDARGTASISLFRLPPTCPLPSSPAIADEPGSSYIMENGIPPGSILVNPHTGKPFLNPDGTPAVYNPPDTQQPIRSQAPQHGSSSQHQQQQQQQVVQYSSVSYTAPQMPVAPSQPYATIEELSAQFAHVSCQPTAGYSPALGVQQPPSHAQAQTVLGTYSHMASHQCGLVQGGVSVSYPQNKGANQIGGEGGYCCVVAPPSHHGSCHPPSCANLSGPAWNSQY